MSNIILLEESLVSIKMLSDNEAGALLRALILHAEGEEPCDLPDKALLLYPFLIGQMDRMNTLRERRAAAGRIGGSKTQANAKQNASKPQAKVKQTLSKAEANVKQTLSKCEANVEFASSKVEAPIPIPIPIPIPEEKESKKKEKVDLPDSGIWASDEVRTAFKEYAQMRMRIKKSLTPDAVKRKIPKLEALTADPARAVEIIQQATDNCWLDFYDTAKQGRNKDKATFNFTERKTDYDALLMSMGV